MFFEGTNERNTVISHNVESSTNEVELNIGNSEVPSGLISVKIRIRYIGDDIFSSWSNMSNKAGKNLPMPL